MTSDADGRARCVAELRQMIATSAALIDQLHTAIKVCERLADAFGRGDSARDVIAPTAMAAEREALSRLLAALETSRHAVRKQFFHLLAVEGMTATEIAQIWGLSRQLISRTIHEPDVAT